MPDKRSYIATVSTTHSSPKRTVGCLAETSEDAWILLKKKHQAVYGVWERDEIESVKYTNRNRRVKND
jgi:hypothetical protein